MALKVEQQVKYHGSIEVNHGRLYQIIYIYPETGRMILAAVEFNEDGTQDTLQGVRPESVTLVSEEG